MNSIRYAFYILFWIFNGIPTFAQSISKEVQVASCLFFNDTLHIKSNWRKTFYNNGEEIENRPFLYGGLLSLCEVRGTSVVDRNAILKVTFVSDHVLEASALHYPHETKIQIRCNKSSLSSLLYNLGYRMSIVEKSEPNCLAVQGASLQVPQPQPQQIRTIEPPQVPQPQPQQIRTIEPPQVPQPQPQQIRTIQPPQVPQPQPQQIRTIQPADRQPPPPIPFHQLGSGPS